MATCPMPWFPMYAQELLSDGDFMVWSPAARGCWLTLSARCWMDGTIPDDLDALARLCGETDAQAMLKHWSSIASKFRMHPDLPGRLFSTRVEEEREKAISKAEKLKNRGEAGATARWTKEKLEKADMLKHPPSNACSMLVDGTSPSPSPSDKDKESTPPASPPASRPSKRRTWRDHLPSRDDQSHFEAILGSHESARLKIISQARGKPATANPSPGALAFASRIAEGNPARLLRACWLVYLRDSDRVRDGFLQGLETFYGAPGGKAKATWEGLVPAATAMLAAMDAKPAAPSPAPASGPSLPALDLFALPGVATPPSLP